MAGGRKTELTQFCEKFPQRLHVVAQPDLPKDVPGMRSGHRGCAREGSPMARGGTRGQQPRISLPPWLETVHTRFSVRCRIWELGKRSVNARAAEMINKALSLVPSHPASAPDLRGSGAVRITSAGKVLAPSPGLLLPRGCRQDWCLQPSSGVVQRAPVLR